MADVQSAVDAGSVSTQDVNAHLLQQQLYTKVTLKVYPFSVTSTELPHCWSVFPWWLHAILSFVCRAVHL